MDGPGESFSGRVFLVEVQESGILAGLTADTRTGDHSSLACNFGRDLKTGISQRLPRCNHRKLRKAIKQA